MGSGDASAELEERRADLSKRLAGKHKERDRWLHLYAQGHISDAELETHLTDLRAQIGNPTLLLESVEDELKAQREYVQVAETTQAWLLQLRARGRGRGRQPRGLPEAPQTREALGSRDHGWQARRREPPRADNLPLRAARALF